MYIIYSQSMNKHTEFIDFGSSSLLYDYRTGNEESLLEGGRRCQRTVKVWSFLEVGVIYFLVKESCELR